MLSKGKSFLVSNFTKHISTYGLYQLGVFIFCLLIISLFSFFHFLLKHKVSEIEEWIYEHGWLIIISSKILSTYVILKFTTLKNSYRKPIKEFFQNDLRMPSRDIFVLSLFFLISNIIFSKPYFFEHLNSEFLKILISFISVILFYFTDIVTIYFIEKHTSISKLEKFLRMIFYLLIFYLTNKLIFPMISFKEASASGSPLFEINLLMTFHFFIILYIGQFLTEIKKTQSNLGNALFYLVFIVAPFSAFFGQDPLWGDLYSPFKLRVVLGIDYYFSLGIVLVAYLAFKSRKSKQVTNLIISC